jgi:hypothetical protein
MIRLRKRKAEILSELTEEEILQARESALLKAKDLVQGYGAKGSVTYSLLELSLVDPDKLVQIFKEELLQYSYLDIDGGLTSICENIISELKILQPELNYPNLEVNDEN